MTVPFKIFFVVGEHSGDMRAEKLIREIKGLRPDWELTGLGGPLMEAAGMELLRNMVDDLAIIGFVEVFLKAPTLARVYRMVKRYLHEERPDAIVLVDYPGFNIMLMAPLAQKLGIPMIYYIVPQFWAWKRGRIKKFKKYFDKMYPVFPFEAKQLAQEGIDADYLGHPLLDEMKQTMSREEVFQAFKFDPDKKLIGMLPGSRRREVRVLLPIMLEAAQRLREMRDDVQFVLSRANTVSLDVIDNYLDEYDVPITVVSQEEYRSQIGPALDFAWVKSGTSTLECALLGVPFLIIYKVHYITGLIGRAIINTPFIGLPNVVAGDLIVPELLQEQATGQNLAEQSQRYLRDTRAYENMQYQLKKIRNIFGPPGSSRRTAESIVGFLEGSEEGKEADAAGEAVTNEKPAEKASAEG
ncbi:lipid-A-disaccharide synthase [bacterium]|nr:lipid-A-disaccharide synthase [bacterium]